MTTQLAIAPTGGRQLAITPVGASPSLDARTTTPQRRGRLGNYAQIRPFDVANGPGIRVSIFVTGCTHNCPGCFNSLYQEFSYGQQWSDVETAQVITYLSDPVVEGLTLLGGEPMQNLWLADVVREIRAAVNKPVWVYSGYTYEQIISHAGRRRLLDVCDVLVDGLFVEALKDLRLRFRGSANQRIIDIAASEANGEVATLLENF